MVSKVEGEEAKDEVLVSIGESVKSYSAIIDPFSAIIDSDFISRVLKSVR